MKRAWLLIVAVCCSATLMAQPPNLKVLSTNYAPYNYQNSKGIPDGAATKMVNALLSQYYGAASDAIPDIEFLPWARSYHLAETTPNTLIYSIARTPEREDKFIWIGRLLPMPVYLYKHTDRDDIQDQGYRNTKLWTVAGVNNGAPTLCVENMGYQILHKSSDYGIQLNMLVNNRVDLMVFDSVSWSQVLREEGYQKAQFEPLVYLSHCSFELYVALNKSSDPQLVDALKGAWQRTVETGTVNKLRQQFEAKHQPFHQ